MTKISRQASTPSTSPRKIAILGGGCGGLSTALELTREANWQQKYDITVYQMGWRLGGKGAAGRNAERCHRIEEHGFHIWLGFYNNAFRMIREVYGELERPQGTPLATWQEAFEPRDLIVLQDKIGETWHHWPLQFPPNPQIPGDEKPQSLFEMFFRGFEYSLLLLQHTRKTKSSHKTTSYSMIRRLGESFRNKIHSVLATTSFFQLSEILERLRRSGERAFLQNLPLQHILAQQLLTLRDQLYKTVQHALDSNPDDYHFWILMDIMLTALAGMLLDGVLQRGTSCLDGQDFTEWLKGYGLSEEAAHSSCIRVCYELTFAYEQGDPSRPAFEAGTGLYCLLLLLFGYRGHIMWEMLGGMGDCIFAPLYQVLKKRGVRFAFFHKIKELHLNNTGQFIDSIDVDVQAEVIAEYEPLYKVKKLDCWPSEPFWEQLKHGDTLCERKVDFESWWEKEPPAEKKTLHRGSDFDLVVLATSLAPLKYLGRALMEQSPPFREMVEGLKTVETQAAQLWMYPSLEEMGWKRDPGIVGGYVEPLGTNADLSNLLAFENWEESSVGIPRSLFYLCGPLECSDYVPLEEEDYPQSQLYRAREQLLCYLQCNTVHLWPEQKDVWSALLAEVEDKGKERLGDWQYIRANCNPDQRYVQTMPGTNKLRLAPGESGFANLVLAGDWTKSPLNSGCVEAAVSSGILAAEAISGNPTRLIVNQIADVELVK